MAAAAPARRPMRRAPLSNTALTSAQRLHQQFAIRRHLSPSWVPKRRQPVQPC